MTLMSGGIAVLGLLLSSPAVVIGAMLISPLMGPIMGLGFAIATFDGAEIRRTATALFAGVALAVAFCSIIVLFSPLQTATSEISSRTRPNLFDLMVALFAGLAGTYAVIRGRHGAIVGVAIATALMPPLAVVGFGLATANWTVLAGSTLLFFTNLTTIAASAAVLARLYGFARGLSPHQTRLQAALIVASLVAFAVPLAFSLKEIAWEALASRQARETIAAAFPDGARVSQLDIDYRASPVEIAATVLTSQYRQAAEQRLQAALGKIMRQPVILSLDQIRTEVGSDIQALDEQSATVAAERRAARLAEQVALVAGVPPSNILVDRVQKRAFVRASELPGADLATYRALESRVAAEASGWTVTLVPPASAALPKPSVTDGTVDQASLDTMVWAARRLRLPIGVAGPRDQVDDVLAAFDKAGVAASRTGGGRMLKLQWIAPQQTLNPPAAP